MKGATTAKKAFALATVILVLSLLVGMAGVVFRDVSVGLQHGAERTLRTQARYAAYAGLQRSLSALYQDPSWSAGYDREDLPGTPEVEYSVTVLNNVGNLNSIFAPDGTEIPPNGVFLRAKGHVRGEDIISNAGLASLAIRKKPIFNFAAVGVNLLDANDGTLTTDGYDANAGPYLPPGAPQLNSHLAGNATVQVTGGDIDGNIELGPRARLMGSPSLTGSTVDRDSSLPVAHYEAPAAFSSSAIRIVTAGGVQDLVPGSSHFDVEMTATTLRMPSGVYYIENDLKLHAGSVLEVVPDADDNPVVIYLGDDLEVFDSTINLDGLPRNVQIYFTSDNRDQTLLTQRNSQAWMVCSGHDVVAILENSHLYGAIQADELTFGNGSQVHYDTSIENQKLDGEAVWSLEGVREGAVD